jgi:hypothetical protein
VLLAMRDTSRKPEADTTEDVAVEGLLSLALLERLAPVGGRELEDAMARPSGQQAEEVAHVRAGLDLLQAAARQKRHEGRVDLPAVVTPDEKPILPANDDDPFILPMSARPPRSTTPGTPWSADGSPYSTANSVVVSA